MHFSFFPLVFLIVEFELQWRFFEIGQVTKRSSAEVAFLVFDNLLNQPLHVLIVCDLVPKKSEENVAVVEQLGHT